jgi:hypothetical protein
MGDPATVAFGQSFGGALFKTTVDALLQERRLWHDAKFKRIDHEIRWDHNRILEESNKTRMRVELSRQKHLDGCRRDDNLRRNWPLVQDVDVYLKSITERPDNSRIPLTIILRCDGAISEWVRDEIRDSLHAITEDYYQSTDPLRPILFWSDGYKTDQNNRSVAGGASAFHHLRSIAPEIPFLFLDCKSVAGEVRIRFSINGVPEPTSHLSKQLFLVPFDDFVVDYLRKEAKAFRDLCKEKAYDIKKLDQKLINNIEVLEREELLGKDEANRYLRHGKVEHNIAKETIIPAIVSNVVAMIDCYHFSRHGVAPIFPTVLGSRADRIEIDTVIKTSFEALKMMCDYVPFNSEGKTHVAFEVFDQIVSLEAGKPSLLEHYNSLKDLLFSLHSESTSSQSNSKQPLSVLPHIALIELLKRAKQMQVEEDVALVEDLLKSTSFQQRDLKITHRLDWTDTVIVR